MTTSPSKDYLRVFLCHASDDKPTVRVLYKKLCSEGFKPWLDEENLIGGQDWHLEISAAVRKAHIVLVCLSRSSITKAGFVQKEIKYALDVADEQPEGVIFIIPLKLEECDVPQRLSRWHWVNYFEDNGYHQLIRSLQKRDSELSIDSGEENSITLEKIGQLYIRRAFDKVVQRVTKKHPTEKFKIGLVGCTGVGKSSIINTLTEGRYLHSSEAVYSNWIRGVYNWFDNVFLIDLPGYIGDLEIDDQITTEVSKESDLIILVVDAARRSTYLDQTYLRHISRSNKPILLIVNRIDIVPLDVLMGRLELIEERTGIPPIPVSSYEGHNIKILRRLLMKLLEASFS